jgi:hypothetical protein
LNPERSNQPKSQLRMESCSKPRRRGLHGPGPARRLRPWPRAGFGSGRVARLTFGFGYGRVAHIIFGFRLVSNFIILYIEYFGLSPAVFLQRNVHGIRTQLMAQSNNTSTGWPGIVCVSNEDGTWTRNHRLVPEREGKSYPMISWPLLTYSVWYFILVHLLCNARCMVPYTRHKLLYFWISSISVVSSYIQKVRGMAGEVNTYYLRTVF